MPTDPAFTDAAAVATSAIEAAHNAREAALAHCRKLVQASSRIIRALHRREWQVADSAFDEAAALHTKLRTVAAGLPEVEAAGYIHDATKEFVEAAAVRAILRTQPIPGMSQLRVSAPAWLNGLVEAASECRRTVLDQLRLANLDEADRILDQMDRIYALAVSVDYPEAVTGGLRRSTDALRPVLERTRADITLASLQARLEDTLRAHTSQPEDTTT